MGVTDLMIFSSQKYFIKNSAGMEVMGASEGIMLFYWLFRCIKSKKY